MTERDHSQLSYELTRENQSLMMSLSEESKKVADLKVQLIKLENGHIELVIKLENADKEIERLTIKLEDAENEIGRLGIVLRHQLENPEAAKRHP
ncbi:MAG TPA: hypothetical protein DCF63_06375 [Planctomycetaceae bacterium]|nr:hypothetical protein [Planctomycetaceae bacterium]